jgi:transglutaminase-like putative cysteine protease
MEFLLSKRVACLVMIFVGSACCVIQAQPAIWQEMKQKYPDENAIFLNRNKTVTISVEGDSVKAVALLDERILFLKDRLANATDMRIFGSHFQEIDNVQASTQVWEKSKYINIPLTGLTRQQEDDASVFYDDSYFYHMSFPAGQAGNQAQWTYTEKYRDARFMSSFYFQDYLPQAKGTFIIRAPKGVELEWRVMNDPSKQIQFKQVEKNGLVQYEWTVENLQAYKYEENSPKPAYYSPLVVYRVTRAIGKSGPITLLADLNSLHKWYMEMIRSSDEAPTPELTRFVHSLISESDTELEKVRKVFYWVQENIRYIAFEDGMRGFVPHKPSYVFEKRYGDCKDMATLIVGMLRAIGITSHQTWIGTRDIPYRYTEMPSPIVDNHMIATYVDNQNRYYFLDGTSNHTPVTFPSAMIQGKEAFIAKGLDAYEVKEVPVLSPALNHKEDTTLLTIDKNMLVGKGKASYTGYQKISASYDFNKAVAQREKENVLQWVKKGSNKFILDSYKIYHLSDNDKPLVLDYEFHVSDYITQVANEIYVNLNLEKAFYNQIIKSDRKTPVEREYNFSIHAIYQLQIPDGYAVEYLPANVEHMEGPVNFAMKYVQQGSQIILDSDLSSNTLLLTPDQFEEWNNAIRKLSNAYKESIILKRK